MKDHYRFGVVIEMATRVPPPVSPSPVPAGDDCANCWGPGKPFGDGDTPESIVAVVSGVNKGPSWFPALGEPRNGTFVLSQTLFVPCLFRFTGIDFITQVRYFLNTTEVLFFIDAGGMMFSASVVSSCVIFFSNEEVNHFVGGTMKITIPEVFV